MKTSLLVFSLLVNAVGVWAIWLRPTPPAIQSEIDSLYHGGVADHRAALELGSVGERFQFDDPAWLRDRLRAAGFRRISSTPSWSHKCAENINPDFWVAAWGRRRG
jgi:hypothetical protein